MPGVAERPGLVVHHPDGEPLPSGVRLERVVDVPAHEGPVYAADEDALYVTTVPVRNSPHAEPRVAIVRIALNGLRFPLASSAVSALRDPAGAANGMTLSPDGGLLVCEQGSFGSPAAITRIDRRTGERERVVVDQVDGMPLNSPNDVVVARDGAIWFTDPSYGYLQGFRPAPRRADAVYRHDPATGRTRVVAEDLDKPNGLAFSPDERVLYVADSGANHEPGTYDPRRPHHVVAYDVVDGVRLGRRRAFADITPGFPDGIKTDAAGRVYVSSGDGVQIRATDRTLLGEIRLPGAVNFTFGGPDGDVLFITTDTAVWAYR